VETKEIDGLTLYYDAGEGPAAELIGRACTRSVALIHDLWMLQLPGECRVYVMTSWLPFLFHSAPWPWRIWIALTLPLRYARMEKLWGLAGGWAQRYGSRQTIGLKPPRLLAAVDAGLRGRIFVERPVDEWVAHNACHELVHAATDPLQLPSWLHEGLAMVTVDRLAGRPTVQAKTLELLAGRQPAARPQEGYGQAGVDEEGLIYLAVRGYWITRYLAETRPELLRALLGGRQPHEALEARLAAELGMDRDEFWARIDGMVAAHFRENDMTSSAKGETDEQ
jgi:hypothetical protein